jgi:hypothetical protein
MGHKLSERPVAPSCRAPYWDVLEVVNMAMVSRSLGLHPFYHVRGEAINRIVPVASMCSFPRLPFLIPVFRGALPFF